jgi:hypothetical protein
VKEEPDRSLDSSGVDLNFFISDDTERLEAEVESNLNSLMTDGDLMSRDPFVGIPDFKEPEANEFPVDEEEADALMQGQI